MNKRFTRRNSDGEARKNPLILEDSIIRKLCEYEDLEEQGLLLRLPCKVGDTVYTPCAWGVDDDCVGSISVLDGMVIVQNHYGGIIGDVKNVFLTRTEAEQALAELQGD